MRPRCEFEQFGIGPKAFVVEIFHLGPDVHRKPAGIEAFDRSRSTATRAKVFPCCPHVVADRRDHA